MDAMPVWLAPIALMAGFVVLTISADALVNGASALALKFGLSPLVVGLTVVAFGTSAPEMVVSIKAVLDGASGLALGNIVGSNIANVFLVLGLPALIYPIAAAPEGAPTNALIGISAAAILIAATFIFGNAIPWQVGAGLFALIIVYVIALMVTGKTGGADPTADVPDGTLSALRTGIYVVAGPVGLALGGSLIVSGGTAIATEFKVDPAIIGLTLVAIGTSLPELAATGVAAFRRQTDVAIGNVLGSNIFNILAVGGGAGLATLLGPEQGLVVPDGFVCFDYWVMAAAALALLVLTLRKWPVSRTLGAAFVLAYMGYLGVLAITTA